MKTDQKSVFWQNIIRATESEPRLVRSIRGLSGFDHSVTAFGIDEKRRRLVIISDEIDARTAALVQLDIQSAAPRFKVVMARPLAIDLSQWAKAISEFYGKTKIGYQEFKRLHENVDEFKKLNEIKTGKLFSFAPTPFSIDTINFYIAFLKDAIQQFSLVDIPKTETTVKDEESIKGTYDFSKLIALDPAEADRRMGICAIPLYEINKEDMEVLKSKPDVEHAREVLSIHGILQYFFPPADQLTLDLVDGNEVPGNVLLNQLKQTPNEGHPFGSNEIIDMSSKFENVIAALQERKLLVEGNIGFELTKDAEALRAEVKFKPREGLISKLSRIFSVKVNLNLKDLIK